MLTDAQVRAFKPKLKTYRKADHGGVYLEVNKDGRKVWRFRIRGPEESYKAIGAYPKVTLRQAREIAESMKAAKAGPAGRSFKEVAHEFLTMQAPRRRASYVKERSRELERDIFPELGDLPINGIGATQILAALRKVEERGVGTLPGRLRNLVSQVFRFAIAAGDCEHDPARDIGPALKAPPPVKHHACIEAGELPALLKAIHCYHGEAGTQLGLLLIMHTLTRTKEAIAARCSPIVFPSPVNPLRPISNNTLLFSLYRLGYRSKMTGHGFRALASTILNEHRERGLIPWSADVIELCLAHELPGGAVRQAYNRGQLIEQRRELMAYWSQFLTEQGAAAIV